MTNIHPSYDNEIDFFDLMMVLWKSKLVIIFFILIGSLTGLIIYISKKPTFTSNLYYKIENIPPFYKKEKAFSDFEKMFFSTNHFADWKRKNSKALLVYENFNTTFRYNDILISKSKGDVLINFRNKKTRYGQFIQIKSKNLKLLNDVYNYCSYINSILQSNYSQRAKDELKIIETRHKNNNHSQESVILKLLEVDRYIFGTNNGFKVFKFERPTFPTRTSYSLFTIILGTTMLSGIIGIFFILIRNSFLIRQNGEKDR